MCQRRLWAWLMVSLLVTGVGMPAAAPGLCQDGQAAELLAGVQARTRALAGALDLPAPRWAEVAPVPDSAAGVAFGPVVRLRPAPEPILLATYLHEAGHHGPPRARPVEEAVAELTRRALVAELLAREPHRALPLLAILVPLPPELAAEGEFPPSHGTAAARDLPLYREASLLAAALWEAVPRPGDSGEPGSQALRLARAARLGRTLSSSEILAMAPAGVEGRRAVLRRFSAGHVLPLLQAALPLAGPDSHDLELLLAASSGDGTQGPWLSWARTALSGDDARRILAHDVLALRAPGDEGELSFLDGWVRIADSREDPLSRERALVRRGTLYGQMGRTEAAIADLMAVLLQGRNLLPAAEAAVQLARSGNLTRESMSDLLDLAPALAACGATGTAVKALALREAGFLERALRLFPHGRLPSPDWAYSAAWAEALAATGRHEEAVALLRQRAADWRRLGNGRTPAAAALMAAVFIEREGEPRLAARAAREIERSDGSPDLLLAETARRWQRAGRIRKAEKAWRRLLRRVPTSDQAGAARRALAGGP
ncbi:MAG: hypothetical protein O7C74_08335 [Acidobacteria bacterium]|nr:hypothetical protein [Acidobacteriota bacterium]